MMYVVAIYNENTSKILGQDVSIHPLFGLFRTETLGEIHDNIREPA